MIRNRGGEPIYYHGPHGLFTIAGGPQKYFNLMLKF